MSKKVGVLGSGDVGKTLANGLESLGFEVTIGTRTGDPVGGWHGKTGTQAEVAGDADLIVFAIKGIGAEGVASVLANQLAGKTVIDTTNPITESGPDEGVLSYFTDLDDSLMERLQKAAPKANFVKAFNSVGHAFMVNPKFKDGKPTMFICGNNDGAKNQVSDILDKFGWEVEDLGGVKSARAIEPLCILWCIPGFMNNEWSHAFKLLKA